MARNKNKKVDVIDPVVVLQEAPVASNFDPEVPLRAVAEKCLPGMRQTWWAGIQAFAKLHGLNPESAKLSACLTLLHAWGGGRIILKSYNQ